jgi:small basic protein
MTIDGFALLIGIILGFFFHDRIDAFIDKYRPKSKLPSKSKGE